MSDKYTVMHHGGYPVVGNQPYLAVVGDLLASGSEPFGLIAHNGIEELKLKELVRHSASVGMAIPVLLQLAVRALDAMGEGRLDVRPKQVRAALRKVVTILSELEPI
jgi:hypothetical protein